MERTTKYILKPHLRIGYLDMCASSASTHLSNERMGEAARIATKYLLKPHLRIDARLSGRPIKYILQPHLRIDAGTSERPTKYLLKPHLRIDYLDIRASSASTRLSNEQRGEATGRHKV